MSLENNAFISARNLENSGSVVALIGGAVLFFTMFAMGATPQDEVVEWSDSFRYGLFKVTAVSAAVFIAGLALQEVGKRMGR